MAEHDGATVVALEPLLSRAEAARVLGISEDGVKRLIRRGELPVVEIGGRRLHEPEQLRDFIAARRRRREPLRSP
jgi:excisionase family DNA binding protein